MQGIAWYNVLANPAYIRSFSYITASADGREELIVDDDSNEDNDCEQSDMVVILLNLAFVKEQAASNFNFESGFSRTFGPEVEKADGLLVGNMKTIN